MFYILEECKLSAAPAFIEIFLEIAKENPKKKGLFLEGRSWTYQELVLHSASFKQELINLGYPKSVGILGDQDITIYAGAIAVLELGLTLVLLNAKEPVGRLMKAIETAELEVIIPSAGAHARINEVLALISEEMVILTKSGITNGSAKSIKGKRTSQKLEKYDPDSICYLTFTSGSTGEPKAVPITQANAAHYFTAFLSKFDFDKTDRFMQLSDLSFDNLHELFICWLSGGCLYPVPEHERFAVTEFVVAHQITVLNSVPSLTESLRRLNLLTPNKLTSLRHILLGGEALHVEDLVLWQAAAPQAQITNLYGPAETTIFVGSFSCPSPLPPSAQSDGVVTIGRLFAPHLALVLDDKGQEAPLGQVGELLMSGPQVFPGYLLPGSVLSATPGSKVDDCFLEREGVRWYRTGDRVFLSPDGLLHFQGRSDQQVKVNGYRVNLSEIETVISSRIPSVRVAVIQDQKSHRLLCVVESLSGEKELVNKIKRTCEQSLAPHMVPTEFVVTREFPLNLNGKVDRKKIKALFLCG